MRLAIHELQSSFHLFREAAGDEEPEAEPRGRLQIATGAAHEGRRQTFLVLRRNARPFVDDIDLDAFGGRLRDDDIGASGVGDGVFNEIVEEPLNVGERPLKSSDAGRPCM